MNDDGEVYGLLDQAAALDYGETKLALLEEAVHRADVLQRVDLGFTARSDLMTAAMFFGQVDKMVVAFSWCLAQFDRTPEQFNEGDLLWKYKWVINALPGFPQVNCGQIDEMLADMERRFTQAGSTLRAVHMLRFTTAMNLGDKASARRHYQRWQQTVRDWLADCPACEQDREVEYAIYMGEDENGLCAAEPVVNGSLRCSEVPHITLGRLLAPLVRLGRLEEAARHHRRGYRMIARNPTFLEGVADHMQFLTLTGNLAKAMKLLEKHLAWVLENPRLDRRFSFHRAAIFLLESVCARGKTHQKLRLSRAFPLFDESGKYALAALHDWHAALAQEIAASLDERNQNDWFQKQLRQTKRWREMAIEFPM